MKELILMILFAFLQQNCVAQIGLSKGQQGIYKRKGSDSRLELKSDNSYILYNSKGSGHYEIEQCSYSSKGRWKKMSNNLLEITSEDYYQTQDGFKYELKKEDKFSQDSLYISIHMPDSNLNGENNININFSFNFNNDMSKYLSTNKRLITLAKKDYLLAKTSNSVNRNYIAFYVNANVSGTVLYKSRIMFKIFEENVDTEKSNYLSIELPYFDLCFFKFEPYNQDFVFIKNEKELIWRGENWVKQHNEKKY